MDAIQSVDTSLETSIDTSQNLEESEISTHCDDGNRSLPCNNSIQAKRDCRSRSRSLSLSTSLKPSPKIPSEFTDCGLDDSRTLSMSLIERKRLFHQAQTHKIMDTKGQAFV